MAELGNNQATAVLRAVSTDGGLWAPDSFPTIARSELCEKSYAERAEVILGAFFGSKVECADAYSQFDDDPATVVKLDDNLFVAELWHGGTRTAADIAACVLPEIVKTVRTNGLTDGVSVDNSDMSEACAIAALTVCYFSAYCDLVNNGEIKDGDKIDFVSPASGFEFIVAGWYARRMGLPINRLVCACSVDGALCDFIDAGVLDTQRVTERDPAIENNIMRLCYDVCGDVDVTRGRIDELKKTGRFSVAPDEIERIRDVITAYFVDDDTAEEVIFDLFDEYGYVADPDTAIAYAAAAEREFVRPTVVISTKDPFLSAAKVMRALGEKNVPPDKLLERMEELTATDCAEYVKIKNSESNL